MSDPARKGRSVLITSIVLVVVGLLVLVAVDGFILRAGEPLCFGQRCLMVTKTGTYVNAEIHGPIAYGSGTLVTYTARGFARSDLDTDNDGHVDCREECADAEKHSTAPCVSRKVGGSWKYEPAGVFDCDRARDPNFWPDAGF